MKRFLINFFELLLILSVVLTGCKTAIAVNAEIKDQPIEPITLESYADVQQRKSDNYQNPNLALGLSISGGGSRAEYYGLGVLMGLDEIVLPQDSLRNVSNSSTKRNFLNDVDYFSTVSGGGFAAGYYLGARKNGLLLSDQSLRDFWLCSNSKFKSNIPYNAKVGNLISKYKKYEKDRRRPSFPDMVDKNILQKGNKDLTNNTIGTLRLKDFFTKAGEEATMPMFVANGTIYNNSERIPFMPHIIGQLNIEKSLMPNEDLRMNNTYNDGYSLPLKYAIAASSGFPGLVPQVKFKVDYKHHKKDSNKYYLRIIDGGVVDNLGFTTLVELLKYDTVDDENKRALIIDCSGEGLVERYAEDKLGQVDLLKHSLMFTLQSKYATFETDIENDMRAADINNTEDHKKYLKIGITDLRAVAQRIKDESDAIPDEIKQIQSDVNQINDKILKGRYEDELKELNTLLDCMETQGTYDDATLKSWQILDSLRIDAGKRFTKKQKQKRWNKFYEKFEMMLAHRIEEYGLELDQYKGEHCQMDLLKTADFGRFSIDTDKALLLLLYELASQVDTNIEIPSIRERSILILAGRYTVYMRREKILELYKLENPEIYSDI